MSLAAATPPLPAASGLPRHVAVIMDGNGRWAKANHLPRSAGHKRGADTLRAIMTACREMGVEYLTVYAFSAENWKRPADEIGELMQLLKFYLSREIKSLNENQVRLRVIGDRAPLSPDIQTLIENAEALTATNTQFHLTVGLSYGGRQEIAQAVRSIAAKVEAGEMRAADVTETHIEAALYTQTLPEPDLLIRTGGEQRLSNFLLWQSAYTEFYFTTVLWPEFTVKHFEEALHEYAGRERRFGAAV